MRIGLAIFACVVLLVSTHSAIANVALKENGFHSGNDLLFAWGGGSNFYHDTLKLPTSTINTKQKLDSIKNVASKPTSAIASAQDSLSKKLTQPASEITATKDSLNRILSMPQTKINQGISVIQSPIDSVNRKLSAPGEKLNKKINEAERKAQEKLNSVQDKLLGKSNQVEGNLQQGVQKLTDGEMKLPDNTTGMPGKDLKIPGRDLTTGNEKLNADIPGLNAAVPQAEIPGTDKLKIPIDKLNADELTKKANLEVPVLDKTKNITGDLKEIEGKLSGVEKYEGDLKKIKENGLADAEIPDDLEAKAADVAGVKELDAASKKLAEQEALIQRYKDKKLLQDEILRKSKNIANDRLNKFSPEFKDAEAKIAKARRINPTIDSMKKERKIPVNTMRGKPFRQRLVPAMTFQVYNGQRFNVDWALQAGYRVSGLFTVGAGYTYRVNFGKDNPRWIAAEGISGYRLYADLTLYKNFYVHADFESASLDRRKLSETADLRVTGSYFGLGRRYNISRKVKGSVAALYRVNYKGEMPGLSKINIRIGFDYNLKKQRHKFSAGRLKAH